MSFIAIIPLWLAALSLYLGSERQNLISNAWPKSLAGFSTLLLFILGIVVFSFDYPWVSSMLAALVVFMLSLFTVTISSGYSKMRTLTITAALCVLSLSFWGASYVA
ncbi:hypothetical protein [Pseudoalteromonas rubra]|uniref:DUF3325 domain-containing protein n=1 Tax=Pseudoalteromonas rubra TaxID=43658 RepID=A0A0U3I705_9GAMM|nr:hypothetical protein [Pseudoalteromonas rubra]ALU45798.1 hypothetical protein AT705_22995 [Pseudoalteromonas rubra]